VTVTPPILRPDTYIHYLPPFSMAQTSGGWKAINDHRPKSDADRKIFRQFISGVRHAGNGFVQWSLDDPETPPSTGPCLGYTLVALCQRFRFYDFRLASRNRGPPVLMCRPPPSPFRMVIQSQLPPIVMCLPIDDDADSDCQSESPEKTDVVHNAFINACLTHKRYGGMRSVQVLLFAPLMPL
jgi:hypothetical protein